MAAARNTEIDADEIAILLELGGACKQSKELGIMPWLNWGTPFIGRHHNSCQVSLYQETWSAVPSVLFPYVQKAITLLRTIKRVDVTCKWALLLLSVTTIPSVCVLFWAKISGKFLFIGKQWKNNRQLESKTQRVLMRIVWLYKWIL